MSQKLDDHPFESGVQALTDSQQTTSALYMDWRLAKTDPYPSKKCDVTLTFMILVLPFPTAYLTATPSCFF